VFSIADDYLSVFSSPCTMSCNREGKGSKMLWGDICETGIGRKGRDGYQMK
jgi:hypothetical protein